MKISVLIPIFNVEKYIQRCISSLFNQQNKDDVEFIFVNDCTKDNSIILLEESIREYGLNKNQYKIINHSHNKGLAAARNTGIENASGDYILLLDSDDALDPHAFSILKEIIENDSPDIIVFGMRFIFPDGTIKSVGGNYVPNSKDQYLKDVIYRNCIVTVCGKLYSRKLFNQVKFIEGLNYGEDYATLPRLIHKANSITDLSNHILYNYYQDNNSSYTKSTIGRNQIDNILRAITILDDYFKSASQHEQISKFLKVRNKIFLLEYVNKEFRNEILQMYTEYNSIKIELSLKHRIVWFLSRKRIDKVLNIFLDLSQWVKSKIHI